MNSEDSQGICYVETKNLDGETNLKHKIANKKTVPCTNTEEDVAGFKGVISCQAPNEYLYKFEGNLKFTPSSAKFLEDEVDDPTAEQELPLDANQMLLRGSNLRNTEYIYGVVIYTGHESKIMKNSPKSRNKTSKIEEKTNNLIIMMFVFQICACTFSAIYCSIWNSTNEDETDDYLGWSLEDSTLVTNKFFAFLVSLGTWLLIFW